MGLPLVPILLAAGAVGAYVLYNKQKGENGPDGLPSAPQTVSKLEKGKTYTVLAVINKDITNDSRWSGIPGSNEEKIRQLIASTFGQSGCKVLSPPTIRSADEMKKAIAGEPSTWVFNMQWMLDGDHITAVIPWLSGASFVKVPTL